MAARARSKLPQGQLIEVQRRRILIRDKNNICVLLVACLCLFASSSCSKLISQIQDPLGPLPFSDKPYTARYKHDGFSGAVEEHYEFPRYADGKGHIRTDYAVKNNHTILIADYTTGKCYALYPDTKTGLWYALRNTGAYLQNADWLKTMEQVTPLGEKEIDGHKCVGWKHTIGTGACDLWFTKDTDCVVLAENKDFPSTMRGAWWKERLIEYSDKSMPPATFSTDGYKINPLP